MAPASEHTGQLAHSFWLGSHASSISVGTQKEMALTSTWCVLVLFSFFFLFGYYTKIFCAERRQKSEHTYIQLPQEFKASEFIVYKAQKSVPHPIKQLITFWR
jgi:hypothetical protein